MGTGDRSDPTTDFFDTHLAQCQSIADSLRDVDVDFVSALDASVALCQAAIANGRRREDMAPVVAAMPSLVVQYDALPDIQRSAVQVARTVVFEDGPAAVAIAAAAAALEIE